MLELTAEERSKLKPRFRGCTLYERLVKISERRGDCYHSTNAPNTDRPHIACCGLSRRIYVQVWIHQNGPVPEGKWILHTCDDERCWRPEHTYAGTHEQNQQDRARRNKSSWLHGSSHPNTRYSDELIAEAKRRAAGGESVNSIARELGLTRPYLVNVLSGRERRSS